MPRNAPEIVPIRAVDEISSESPTHPLTRQLDQELSADEGNAQLIHLKGLFLQ